MPGPGTGARAGTGSRAGGWETKVYIVRPLLFFNPFKSFNPFFIFTLLFYTFFPLFCLFCHLYYSLLFIFLFVTFVSKCKTPLPQGGYQITLNKYHIVYYRQQKTVIYQSDVWLTVHRNSVWIRKTNWKSLFVFFISLLIVAQHVSGNHVPTIRSWRLRDVIASCWYVPWLQGGCQVRLAVSASMDGFVAQRLFFF